MSLHDAALNLAMMLRSVGADPEKDAVIYVESSAFDRLYSTLSGAQLLTTKETRRSQVIAFTTSGVKFRRRIWSK